MVTKHTSIPEQSVLKHEEPQYSYIDSFRGVAQIGQQPVSVDNVACLFLTAGPKWADTLMNIRDKVAGVFGLKTSKQMGDGQNQAKVVKYEVGQRMGIFKVIEKTDHEIILGEEDKHLNFKVSLLLETVAKAPNTRRISITTAVKFNNFFGKVYFFPVKPIHGLIVKISLKNIIKQIESVI